MRYRERDIWLGTVGLAVISLALLLYADFQENRARLADFQQRQAQALGDSVGRFRDYVQQASQDLLFLSQLPEIRGLKAAETRERLESYIPLNRERGVVQFFLTDGQGEPLLEVASRSAYRGPRPPRRLDRAELSWAFKPENMNTVSVELMTNPGGAPSLELKTPVYDTSGSVRMRGVFGAVLDLEPLVRRNLNRQISTAKGQSLLLAGDRVIASEPTTLAGSSLDSFTPQPRAGSVPFAAPDGHEGSAVIDWKGEAGAFEASSVAWWPLQIGDERWLLIAATPRSEIGLPAERRLVFLVGWLIFTASLWGASAILVRLQRRQHGLLRDMAGEQQRSKEVTELAWQNALLAQIVDEIRHSMDRETITRIAVERLGTALKVSRTVIYLPDGPGGHRIASEFARADDTAPIAGDALPPLPIPPGEFSSPFSEEDLADHSDPEVRRRAEQIGARACLLAPVPLGRGGSGALVLLQERPRSWKATEVRFAERIATQVGTALEQAGLYAEQVRAAEVRAALLKVGPALSTARDSAAVLAQVAREAARLTESRRTLILVRDAEQELLRAGGGSGFAPEDDVELSRIAFNPPEHPYLEEVLHTLAPVVVANPSRDPRVPESDARLLGLESMLLVTPLLYGQSLLGAFLFESEAGKLVGQTEMEVAQAISELTSAALMNARLFEALRASESRYQDLYDNAPDMFQTLDRRGVILDCNQTQSRLLGFAKTEMVGQPLAVFLASDSADTWEAVRERIFERGFVQDVALKLRRKDGKILDVSLNASVIQDPSRAAEAARAVLRDVTELKGLEHQLHQSQKLEVIGTLAGGLAHDFNNILGGILGYASLLRTHFQGSPEALKFLETIERSATRGKDLTAKLLAASRRGPTRLEPVDLNQLVGETIEILERTLHKSVQIDTQLDGRLKRLLGDRSQLQQVVLNLCVNARDAMPSGGRLGVETELLEEEQKVRISVNDNGVGMDAQILDRIYEPFFSTKGTGGTGLGLTVVYGIVKANGGDIQVTSTPGRGARFDILLPARWAEEMAPEAARPENIKGQGQLVLLVDDEETLRDLGREILKRSGYRVETASGGAEAVEIFRSRAGEVSLVIVDMLMPGMDGAETCRQLRALQPGVPILLSSGFSQEGIVEKLLREGPGDFLPKPYTMADLTRVVARVLAERKRSAEG
jgi:PAS domain S-box-containing protein